MTYRSKIDSERKRRVTISTMNGFTIERYIITDHQMKAVRNILDTMTKGCVSG